MSMDFEDNYLGVLQNMEFMIIQVYRKHPELTDFLVDKAMESLLRLYQAEKRGKSVPTLKFSSLDQHIYEDVKSICEFYLGRPSMFKDGLEDLDDNEDVMLLGEGEYDEEDLALPSEEGDADLLEKIKANPEMLKEIKANLGLSEDDEIEIELSEHDARDVTVDEIIACIKRIRSSISLWTKQSGRQGYLAFINPFLP